MADVVGRVEEQDEQKLAELGYKQELVRAWSGFTNFAISFTIISVLAGTFTTFGQAWNAGGPIGSNHRSSCPEANCVATIQFTPLYGVTQRPLVAPLPSESI